MTGAIKKALKNAKAFGAGVYAACEVLGKALTEAMKALFNKKGIAAAKEELKGVGEKMTTAYKGARKASLGKRV